MSSPPPTISLYDTLTRSTKQPLQYQATFLIQSLLKAVSYDACKAKRNTSFLYSVIADIGDAYTTLNRWIDSIDRDTNAPTELEDIFAKYIDGIEILEKELLALSVLLQSDAGKEESYPGPDDSLDICFELASSFLVIRDTLSATAAALGHFELKDLLSKQRPAFGDDYASILDIEAKVTTISKKPGFNRLESQVLPQITAAKVSLEDWAKSTPASEEIATEKLTIGPRAVQFWMLTGFVFEKAEVTKDDSRLGKLVNDNALWEEIDKMGKLVNEHLQDDDRKLETSALEKGYNAFVDFLKSRVPVLQTLPAIYYSLRKAAGKIGRPYFLQAVTLIKECAELANTWDKRNIDQQTALEKVFTNAQQALVSAIDNKGSSPILPATSPEVDGNFKNVQEEIEKCFLPDMNFEDWKQKMDEAKKKDIKRKEEFETKVSKRVNIQPEQSDPPITVSIKMGDDVQSFGIDKGTSLGAVIWSRRQFDPTIKASAHFTRPDSSRLPSEMKIEEAVKAAPYELILVPE